MKSIKMIPCIISILFFCIQVNAQQIITDTLPFGGNAYVNGPAIITDEGLTDWREATSVPTIYFRTEAAQSFGISLLMKVNGGESVIGVNTGNYHFTKKISNKKFEAINIGEIVAGKPGYIKIALSGISKTGNVFADISGLLLRHKETGNILTYVKNGSSFHFGRRGPSVHLNFRVPVNLENDVNWFYNEITIPAGMDKLGSYFMADGFEEGYFGMQVNSESERRILFSVWSPFETDNPQNIPDSLKVVLLKKGEGVQTHDFGDEGSGGQSFMPFMWKAGNTYGFLLHASPDSIHHTTTYTAYFKDIQAGKWFLIASFNRPQTLTRLTHLYSFLENFIPETGDETRMGFYKNQWIADSKNEWHELTEAVFTVDATAKGGFRKDYAGGVDGENFFLKNDGFFNEYVKPNQKFSRKSTGKKPAIDFENLLLK